MDYRKLKDILIQQHNEKLISDEEFKKKIAECDRKLDEQAKRLVELFGKL